MVTPSAKPVSDGIVDGSVRTMEDKVAEEQRERVDIVASLKELTRYISVAGEY